MTTIRITRGEKWWVIAYGFGTIQRIRAVYAQTIPESALRATIANPEITDQELIDKMSPEERIEYKARMDEAGIKVINLLLRGASDIEKGGGIPEYVNDILPEDVGREILSKVRDILNATIPDEVKKNS